MKKENIKKFVKESYGAVANSSNSCCSVESSCCGSESPEKISRQIGYSNEDLSAIPEGSNMGLGCGNPVAVASLIKETIKDTFRKDAVIMLNVTGGGEERFKEGKSLYYLKPSQVFETSTTREEVKNKLTALFGLPVLG